jgi:hypothetical protein
MMHRVAMDRGEPCNITYSDNSYVGHMEIWYYDCGGWQHRQRELYLHKRSSDGPHQTLIKSTMDESRAGCPKRYPGSTISPPATNTPESRD